MIGRKMYQYLYFVNSVISYLYKGPTSERRAYIVGHSFVRVLLYSFKTAAIAISWRVNYVVFPPIKLPED